MSGNRSIQAAQRRRTGPPDPQPPGRSAPQPSINSSQLFANQMQPGQGPYIPPGRIAAHQHQQATMQQQQAAMQQQQAASINNISKMTLAQAITLITLRLGAVESKLINFDPNMSLAMGMGMGMNSEGNENMLLIDNEVIASLNSRIDNLEKNSNSSINVQENNLLKQQIEIIKQSVNQTKIFNTNLSKENKELKNQIDYLKKEIDSTKEILILLQNITMENSQKLMNYSLEDMSEIENSGQANFEHDDNNDLEQNEIIGTNLKELIENEINANA